MRACFGPGPSGFGLRGWSLFLAIVLTLTASTAVGHERVLRIAYLEDPKTLDPTVMMEEVNFELVPLLFIPLLDTINVTNIIPCGASSWSASPDWRTFTFHLRPDAHFSNGRPVTASDYAFCLERTADAKTGSQTQTYVMGISGAAELNDGKSEHLSGIQVPDEHTLIIQLDHPDLTFPYVVANFCVALPAEILTNPAANFSSAPVGDGPYKVSRFRRGDRLLLEPNPFYSGPEPRHFDRIEIYLAVDEATQMMMFERGELDIIRVPFSQMQRTGREPQLKRLRENIPLLNSTFLVMNNEIAPLTDVRVRRAICHGIDRQRRMLVQNGGFEVATGIVPRSLPGFDPDLKGYDYAPEKARALLREAGVKTPLRLDLWYAATDPFFVFLAQGIASDLGKIGLELNLVGATHAALDDATTRRGRVPLSLNGWNVALPDPKDMLANQLDGRTIGDVSLLDTSFYNNPEVNQLFDQASVATDLRKRFSLYHAAERQILQDAPMVFLGYRHLFALRQARVKGPMLDQIWWFRFDRVFSDPAN